MIQDSPTELKNVQKTNAKCSISQKIIDLSTMGVSEGKKHQKTQESNTRVIK